MTKFNTRLICFTLLSVFILNGSVYSQLRSGYVITNENDTIYGNIEFEGSITNSYQCMFTSSFDNTTHTYFPGDIRGFRFIEGKYFTSDEIMIDGQLKKVFLEWLIKGKASLLTFSPHDTDIRYFLVSELDSIQELINTKHLVVSNGSTYEHQKKEYVGLMLSQFRDAPSLANDIRNVNFSTKPLIRITKEYHELTCPNEECLVFEDKTRKMKYAMGATVSMQFSNVKFNDKSVEEKAYLTNSFGFGIALDMSNLPLVSPKFSISTGALYYSMVYKYDIDGMPYYISDVGDNRICEFKDIKIPFQFNYSFLSNKFSPFISAGLFLNMRLGYKEFNEYLVYYVTAHTASGYNLGMATFQAGLTPGFGLKYSLSGKSGLKLKFDYEYGFKFYGKSIKDHSNTNNYIIQASYLYSF
jgi:hypothetical protein